MSGIGIKDTTLSRHAGIYIRLSKDRDGLSTSIDDQARECTEYAERKGWSFVVFADNDVPASEADSLRKKPRPSYRRLTAALKDGSVDAVIVWATDRLYRHPRDLEDLITLLDGRKVELVALHSGLVDLSTPEGRAQARIGAAMNKAETERLSDRVSRKKESLAREGKPSGGTRPFGYADDAIGVNPAEAELIRQAAADLINGVSARTILRQWKAAGVKTARGKEWSRQALKKVLTSLRIIGRRDHHGEDIGPAVWPAILDRRTWDAVRAVYVRNAAATPAVGTPKHILTGILRCYTCASPLVSRTKSAKAGGYRMYVCTAAHETNGRGSGKVTITAAPVEEYVARRASDMTLTSAHAAVDPELVAADLREARDAAQADLDGLAKLLGEKQIGTSEYLVARAPMAATLDSIDAQIAERAEIEAASYSRLYTAMLAIPDTWAEYVADAANAEAVRADIEAKVELVVVRGANGRPGTPVSERVRIVWREGVVTEAQAQPAEAS